MAEIRDLNNNLVGKTYLLPDEDEQLLEIARKDCITQFIWPSSVDVRVIQKPRFEHRK